MKLRIEKYSGCSPHQYIDVFVQREGDAEELWLMYIMLPHQEKSLKIHSDFHILPEKPLGTSGGREISPENQAENIMSRDPARDPETLSLIEEWLADNGQT
jgi:hypothetical protein